MIVIKASGKTLQIFVEVKKKVYPRDLRNAVYQLQRSIHETRHYHEAIGLLAADVLSQVLSRSLRNRISPHSSWEAVFI